MGEGGRGVNAGGNSRGLVAIDGHWRCAISLQKAQTMRILQSQRRRS